ncbi:MAG: RDD family protein [Candidatus Acidiferrales bacterium]
MFCSRCGAQLVPGATFCGTCGQAVGAVAPAAAPSYAPAAYAPPKPYAGFWLRAVAYLIDGLIVGLPIGLVFIVLIFATGMGGMLSAGSNEDAAGFLAAAGVLMIMLIVVVALAGMWLYYAWFESSRHQATLGKMAMGIIVTDMNGQRVSFGRATGRYFAKLITGMIPLMIGYIMAGFTEKKQALHDMIASCLVLRKA